MLFWENIRILKLVGCDFQHFGSCCLARSMLRVVAMGDGREEGFQNGGYFFNIETQKNQQYSNVKPYPKSFPHPNPNTGKFLSCFTTACLK